VWLHSSLPAPVSQGGSDDDEDVSSKVDPLLTDAANRDYNDNTDGDVILHVAERWLCAKI